MAKKRRKKAGRTPTGVYSNKSYKKPLWMRIVRIIAMFIIGGLMIVVIIYKAWQYYKIVNH
ncbi:hypothetical protein [Mucilaginibacter sp. 44-25]|jgi:hypothetical protein|uniref:hypothetical protein n=1 Tax=Mucilaginibacter sp. 44-25 TaxID=1895794 RepID=UPI000AF362E5|nr:hypothetical protein [Mucilaginibacter sp. 44-25]